MRRVVFHAWTAGAATFGALACAVLAGASVVTMAPAAFAQEVISTAAGAPGDGAPPAPESGPMHLSDRTDQGPDIMRPVGPCGGPALKEDGTRDKSPHGEVWAGVGTNGYRDIGGAVCAPLGDNAALSVAVDAGQLNGWGRRR